MLSSVHKSQSIVFLFSFNSDLLLFLLVFLKINRLCISPIRNIIEFIMFWSSLSSFQRGLVVCKFYLIHQIRLDNLYIVILVYFYFAIIIFLIKCRLFWNCYFKIDYISFIECCMMRLNLLWMIFASMRHYTKRFMFCY